MLKDGLVRPFGDLPEKGGFPYMRRQVSAYTQIYFCLCVNPNPSERLLWGVLERERVIGAERGVAVPPVPLL
ncbi:hypothetical protein DXA27_01505 [Bacteroides fragilis]|uniref:Uncharacterized protein n=1 Tax=Bacteroides fragilis TaxID=817 RepID=A0A413K6Z1_BACFG|nr:hypothetical protein DXA27_01505 [Bacteroides fragilis]